MPAAAGGVVEEAPVRRVVSILRERIDELEKRRIKQKSSNQNGNGEDLSAMLEFAWDLTKQCMGIAVLSENEAKKQARKDVTLRKSQDLQLAKDVLLVLNCLNQLNDPIVRADFISGTHGAPQLSTDDIEVIDKLCPELSAKAVTEEDAPCFDSQATDAAKHVLAIIEADQKQVAGTTYAHIKHVITTICDSGYLDHPREEGESKLPEEITASIREESELIDELGTMPPPPSLVSLNPPPAAQAISNPSFSILPPRAPPVTLQQVEHAYFAQYNHQQPHPPVPEVIGPQSFIFLQDSELDNADISQQPTPRPDSPVPASAIPSQTFTNQTYVIPPQHFTPDLIQNPHIPISDIPQPVHYPTNVDVPNNHIANFSSANAPPMPLPPTHPIPPHMAIATQVVNHPHPLQPRLPSPFQQNLPFKPQAQHPAEQPPAPVVNQNESNHDENHPITPIENDSNSREWETVPTNNGTSEQPLEIDEWNPPIENNTSENATQTNNQNNDKFRPRGRGRGTSSGFRGRGGYQNGRSGNWNGKNYNENYRERSDGNRFDSSQGYHDNNYRGRGVNGRGSRQNGGSRGAPRGSQSQRGGGQRLQYPRKTTNNQYESRNGGDK